VTTASHGDQQVLRAGQPDGGAYVGDSGAAGYQCGTAVNRPVPYLAMLVVASVIRADDFAPKGCLQFIDSSAVDLGALCHWTHGPLALSSRVPPSGRTGKRELGRLVHAF